MQVPSLLLALALLLAGPGPASAAADRTITQVVKLLQGLLDTSKADGDKERDLYAKYKCYCDTNEATKKEEIAKLTEEIGLLESKIEELQASTGKLSEEVAQLDKDKIANLKAQEDATAIRKKENDEFVALEKDLVDSIAQLDQAIDTLAQVAADQTLGTGADHSQYMAGYASLTALKSTVRKALMAASAFLSEKQVTRMSAFLQGEAPFTGTYTAQSGEVVGILKEMRDTFKANLATARAKEATALKAYNEYMDNMKQAYKDLDDSYQSKQGMLGGNDEDLSGKKTQLTAAETQLADAQDFLAKLLDMCSAKAKQYQDRVALRSNEEVALSEAISILNSDAAFATFGTTDATKTGATSFVQLRRASVRRHRALGPAAPAASPREKAKAFLQHAAGAKGDHPLLARIAALLQANNPFTVVLAEIEKMIGLIEAEEKADVEQKAWCDKERTDTNTAITDKATQITALIGEIDELTNAIEDPSTGLKATIKNTEDLLQVNYNSQVSETADRKEETAAYSKDIANLVEAEALLDRAIHVLTQYYSKITAAIQAGLIQKRADPAPPATWDDTYKGQSQGGTSAIGMLQFILKNTKAEETAAHDAEKASQASYEDSMQSLKTEEATLQDTLARSQKELAEKEASLLQKKTDLDTTMKQKEALEAYLVQIKPGCDFITTNIDTRKANRVSETDALNKAVTLIKGTPAYSEAMAKQHVEDLGECADICKKGEELVGCKACLAKVTVPGYCAGHPSTQGC